MAVVAVIDDSEKELQHALLILNGTGQFEAVYGFTCPDEAYCFMLERSVDVLFMEIVMKGLNCFVLMDKLRKMGRDNLFVIVTSTENYAYEAFQKGISDYVLKPLSSEDLARVIEKIRKCVGRSNNH